MRLTRAVYSSINNNQRVLAVFIDIAKAFDAVNHKLLLKKVYEAGFRGKAYDWLASYMSLRKQFVKIRIAASDVGLITSGVPRALSLVQSYF